MIGAIAGTLVLLLGIVAVVVAMMSRDDGDSGNGGKTTQAGTGGMLGTAAKHLSGVPALKFDGSFSSGGETVQSHLTVTRSGFAIGTLTLGGKNADVVVVDGKTFIKAGAEFWRAQGGSGNPEDYADRWSRAPEAALDLDIAGTLAPNVIAQRLRSADSAQGSRTAGPARNVNGTPALRVTTTNGDAFLSPASPYPLLQVAATGSENYQFDVTEVDDTAAQATFGQLRDSVRKLAGARDPSVRFVPGGTLRFSNCNNNVNGCTLELSASKVAASDGGQTGDVRAVMIGTIKADGRTLGSCTGGKAVGDSRTVQLSCTVTSSGWRSWMRKARSTPGTHRYSAQARVVAEAMSQDDVKALLTKIDQEERGA